MSFSGYLHAFLLDIYLPLALLGHGAHKYQLYSALQKFSKVVVQICSLTSRMQDLQLLHINVNTWHFLKDCYTLLLIAVYFLA